MQFNIFACVFELYFCFIRVPAIFTDINYFFLRKHCLERLIQQLYQQKFLFVESQKKKNNLCYQKQVPEFSETFLKKSMCQNNTGNRLLRPFKNIIQKTLEPSIATGGHFFCLEWWIKQVVLFFLMKCMILYLRHSNYVLPWRLSTFM